MVLTSSVRSVSSHNTVGVPDDSERTLDCAHAAANEDRRIDHRFSIRNTDRSGRTFPLAYAAGDARIITCLASGFPEVPVAAFDLYVAVRQYDLYKVLRAGVGTESAAYAFISIYDRRSVSFDLYSCEMTGSDTQTASYAAVCTADAAAPAAYICFFLYPLCHGPSFLQPVAGICKDSFKHSATDGERLFGNRQMIRGSSPRIDISGFQAFGYGSSVLKQASDLSVYL